MNIHCLGITEANLRTGAELEEVNIPGYNLVWDRGRENKVKENSRVVAYIREDLSYEVVKTKMQGDLMPELWIRLGHKGTRKTLVGFIYREHSPWGVQQGSVKEQEQRWTKWLEACRDTWEGSEEAFVLGDLNLDWKRKDDPRYRNKNMVQDLCSKLVEQSWVPLIGEVTHFTNRAGITSESLIDHVWTNSPLKVLRSGQEELAASDHHLVWVERVAKKLVEQVKRTEKRSMKNFRQEDLEELCRQQNWQYRGPYEKTEETLEKRVAELEEKIIQVIEHVAPMMVKKTKQKGKPSWITEEIKEKIRERVLWRKIANHSKRDEDEMTARQKRNEAGKVIKEAKKEHLGRKLENLGKNSPDSWAAVGEFLGWRKPVSPTMLVQDGNIITADQQLAEAMTTQYMRKEVEVEAALGQAQGDYLAEGRRMTQGNKAVFRFKKVTKKEVEAQIRKVDNKESFGHDKISYGFLKKMSPWIAEEMKDIMNMSLDIGKYPRRWKIARVKPMYKGGGCDRQAPKSYRPVALLSATSRIMEALLARQLDAYQEEHGLVHKEVHGFRRGRGTNTAMLEVWEYVLNKTDKGELVALDFLDISAGFDTMVHLYLLRQLEVQFGVAEESLAWLASYLEGWLQYTVVESSSSAPRKMSKGAPQGGGLSPILWRSNTNNIPEAGLTKSNPVEGRATQQLQTGQQRKDNGLLSQLVDGKARPTMEEQLDKQFRSQCVWDLVSWREERSGLNAETRDTLKTKEKNEAEDVLTTIYADDTQSRASAKTKKELEERNSRGLTKVCEQLKALRLKVNEDKTTYMILATQGRRAREDLESEIVVCGEKVKSVKVGKALGLLVSHDMTWKDQVDKTVKSCQDKLRGLWKCTEYLKQHQRKVKAEGVILSRLTYCLEVVSTGRKVELERLQGVQGAAARWVLQTRKRDWSLSGGLKKLGWLSLAQLAVYASLKLAVRVLKDKKPERLYELLTEEEGGERVKKRIMDNQLKKMKATTKKAWSVRVLRWLELMPGEVQNGDMTKRKGKEGLKKWIKHVIPVRGDRILWGQPLTGDQRRRRAREDPGPNSQGEGGADNSQRQRERGAAPESQPGLQAAGAQANLEERRDTLSTERHTQDSRKGSGKYWQELGRKDQDTSEGEKKRIRVGTEPGGLPCSRAAVVLTSPWGSREAKLARSFQQGEQQGGKDADAARKPPQVRLHGQEASLSGKRTYRGQYCLCSEQRRCSIVMILASKTARGSLDWRKGVG